MELLSLFATRNMHLIETYQMCSRYFNLKCIFNETKLYLSETGITIDCYELIGNLLDKFQCRSQTFTFIQTNKNVYNKNHVDR